MQSISFVFVGLFVVLQGVLSACPDGFEHHGTKCYKISGLEASWIEAKFYCRMGGSDLAIINTAVEEAFIEGMLARLHGAHIDEEYWISGADIIAENEWRWMAGDGQSMTMAYTNWGHGRPDNNGGQENCLLINYRGSSKIFWNDEKCNVLHSFVCEVGWTSTTDAAIVG